MLGAILYHWSASLNFKDKSPISFQKAYETWVDSINGQSGFDLDD